MKTQSLESARVSKWKDVKYCGLSVRVLFRMEHCSMIEYGNRRFIVDTADLRCARAMQRVA